jgi:hypothetical protein
MSKILNALYNLAIGGYLNRQLNDSMSQLFSICHSFELCLPREMLELFHRGALSFVIITFTFHFG